jgi:hypothetical protein
MKIKCPKDIILVSRTSHKHSLQLIKPTPKDKRATLSKAVLLLTDVIQAQVKKLSCFLSDADSWKKTQLNYRKKTLV